MERSAGARVCDYTNNILNKLKGHNFGKEIDHM